MNHDHSNHDQDAAPSGSFWTSRAFLVCLGFAAIAIILLWKEHQAHILGALPFLSISATRFSNCRTAFNISGSF